MAGQEKDPFEGLGEFAKYFRGNPFFNLESAQQQKQEGEPQQPLRPQQPTGQKPAEQPVRIGRLVAEHFQGLEGILAGEEESYRLKGQQLDTALLNAQKKKGSALTPQEIKDISDSSGIGLSSYLFCGMSPPEDTSKMFGVFWNGDERAPLPAKYVPGQWLKGLLGAENNTYFCPNHIVFISINAMYKGDNGGRYTRHEALVIEPWRKIQNPEEANVRLKELGLADVELLPYTEKTLRNGELGERGMQALVFPAEKYTEDQKRQALARLRGEQPNEIAQQPPASYTTAPAEAQKPQTPPRPAQSGGIEELLPKGRLEETNQKLTVEVIYEGEPYKFLMPVLLNEFLAIDGEEGYRLAGTGEVTFTGRMYVEDAAARREAELTLIAKDKRLRLRMGAEQQKTLETALQQEQNPAAKQSLIRMAISYVNEPGSGQQTL